MPARVRGAVHALRHDDALRTRARALAEEYQRYEALALTQIERLA
ncbi:MAG: hypothetical protein JWN04_3646 [Myxococcaceae bacterium]|nr:hypothetical protein [Myxococcaceae bacterium]